MPRDDEEKLRPIREALERVRERVDYAIGRIQELEEVRCLRWRCTGCGYLKHFTKPMPAAVATPCPKCRSQNFMAAP